MPEPIETVKFNLSDLEKASLNQQETFEASNLLVLQSQFQVGGLKELHDAIDDKTSYRQLREEYGTELLRDLEKLSKRPAMQGIIPEFKPEFYEDIKKDTLNRSPELKRFLEDCSKLSDANGYIERISAKMLIDSGTIYTGHGVGILKTELSSELDKYKAAQKKAVDKDFSKSKDNEGNQVPEREIILIKGKDGKVTGTTLDKLGEIEGLTKEQIGFIANCWQQGTFSAGYLFTSFPSIPDSIVAGGGVPNSNDKTSLFLDLSQGGKVVVSSRAVIKGVSTEDLSQTPAASSLLSADITDLTGTSFTPGLSSARPEITMTISRYDTKLTLPEELAVENNKHLDKNIKTIEAESQQFYVDQVLTNGPFAEKSKVHLKTNLGEEKTKHTIQEAIVASSLEKWCSNQTDTKLNDQKLEHIKEGLIAIVAPVCSEEEQKILEKNTARLVRECANKKDMSWGQFFTKKFDKAVDAIRRLTGRENELQQIMDKYPQVVETLKKSINSKSQDTSPPTRHRSNSISLE